MPKDLISFNFNWISLPKCEFKLLVMIADIGSNIGNASDICKYFNLTLHSKNMDNLRKALQNLADENIIILKQKKNNYIAEPIAQKEEKKILIERKYVTEIQKHNYTQSVAWETVLMVYIWLLNNGNSIFTNRQIGECIGVSDSTVTKAKNALQYLGAVIINRIIIKEGEQFYKCIGQSADLSAFWNNV